MPVTAEYWSYGVSGVADADAEHDTRPAQQQHRVTQHPDGLHARQVGHHRPRSGRRGARPAWAERPGPDTSRSVMPPPPSAAASPTSSR